MPSDARLLADRIAILGVRLSFHEHAVLAGNADTETERALLSVSAAFRKSLQLLYEMRRQHASERSCESVEEYVERKTRERR